MKERPHTLESVARADVGADRAKEILRDAFEDGDVEGCSNALLRWSWVALSQRRKDPDLRRWHRLIRSVALWMREAGRDDLSDRLSALRDLVRISVETSGFGSALEDLSGKQILRVFYEHPDEDVSLRALRRITGIPRAELSRRVLMLCREGLVERSTTSAEASFRITVTGRMEVARL